MHTPSPQLLRALRVFLTPRPVQRGPSIYHPFQRVYSSSSGSKSISISRSITPRRMIPRAHASKPGSRDRGPVSPEDTQTDLAALNVLGSIPTPATAVDACLDNGFHLDNGVKVTGGDGVLLVNGEAFAWRPWNTASSASLDARAKRAVCVNSKGQFDVDEQVWGLLSLVWPRPGLSLSLSINSLGIRVEVQDTRNAAAQFNLLATERGVGEVAAALIPIGWKGHLQPFSSPPHLFFPFTCPFFRRYSTMPQQEPLLARPSSDRDSLRNAEEEDALLTGERSSRYDGSRQQTRWTRWREVGLLTWAVLATAAVIIVTVVFHQHERANHHHHHQDDDSPTWGPGGKPTGKRNLIFMVSDGMGPASLAMTRGFRQLTEGLPMDDTLVLDQHFIGTSRTRSSSSLVTDSAAGATAFSCGFKSYNGAISVLPDETPCGTVLEAAALAGYRTGLVVTTRITDATPACFASHVTLRSYEDRIAEQEIGEHPLGRVVDLMLGGGRCHFLPNTTEESCRADDRDLIAAAEANGFNYISDRAGFDALNDGTEVQLPLLGLFAGHDIPFEIDRRSQADTYPSLEEMARTALTALSQATADSEQGFFLMIEGSRIDHAGHGNDPAAQVHEVLAYDRAFAAVLDFLDKDSTPGVLVSTSDHETGGLAVARQLQADYPEYKWYPGVLANASHSAEHLAAQLKTYLGTNSKDGQKHQRKYVYALLEKGLGVTDATEDEVDLLLDPELSPSYVFADIISRRAQIGWSTHGHSAVDVNIYASSSKTAWPLLGNHENTEVGSFLADYLDLNLENITSQLQAGSWMGGVQAIHVDDKYHGEFKH
ncbi:hypothetical protein ASPZODRAFT_87506 [Penicilliopsis zonata CBS 506.65]|uniref:Alkaline phosphatase n=1 Tax=Penicilliopsis zonata CBS 506.65 TaxID=1073090 RepID=A0A1L9SVS2_9EURO|nr:hypothetical protein ASPZODRAFT_87506 [Penicilliopsis zonata CBS 506.65]OJJ51300.1 hypothetical protein ASPZODRAFT_87506 [Penicilliopsis zonata CBS 506.65]